MAVIGWWAVDQMIVDNDDAGSLNHTHLSTGGGDLPANLPLGEPQREANYRMGTTHDVILCWQPQPYTPYHGGGGRDTSQPTAR
jgi:hypothetical protein